MKNRSFATLVVIFPFVCANYAVAQAAARQPDFTLTVSVEDQTVVAQKDMDISASVEEKNISNHPVDAGRTMEPGEWYNMVVLCDGKPAPITPKYQHILSPLKEDPSVAFDGSVGFWTIQPGHAMTFHVELSLYFDFSTPGKYEITFSRGTDPGQPDNVDVKSNTVTLTVLPPGSALPTQN